MKIPSTPLSKWQLRGLTRRSFVRRTFSLALVGAIAFRFPNLANAAVTVRYFSTTAAGAGDGTTWADRAELDPAGGWSTVITGTDFVGGGNSLVAYVGPGTYTFTTALVSGSFANPPTAANPLLFCACDSSGVALAIPDPDWVSSMPAFDDSTLPVLTTSTNIATISLTNCYLRLLKFTASGRTTAGVVVPSAMDWCVVENSTANTATAAITTVPATNCVFSCTGASYSAVVSTTGTLPMDNVRVVGVTGSSGNRDGIAYNGTTTRTSFVRVTITGCAGRGFAYVGSNAGVITSLSSCTIVNNGGDGITFPNTAAQTQVNIIDRCQITGNGGYGINPGGANTNLFVTQTRLRDNTSGNFGTFGNFPTDLNIYTTDSDDATEYVNSAGGDFRIKNTAATWGLGFGAGDQPAASGGRIIGGL